MEFLIKIALSIAIVLTALGMILFSNYGMKGFTIGSVSQENKKVSRLLPLIVKPFKFSRMHETTKDQFGQPRLIPSELLWTSINWEYLPIQIFDQIGVNVVRKNIQSGNSQFIKMVELSPLTNRAHLTDPLSGDSTSYKITSDVTLTYFYHCQSDRKNEIVPHLHNRNIASTNPTLNELKILDFFSRASANGVFANMLLYYSDPVFVEYGGRSFIDPIVETKLNSSAIRRMNECESKPPFIQYYVTTDTKTPLSAEILRIQSFGFRETIQIGIRLIKLVESLHTDYGIVHGNINFNTVLINANDYDQLLFSNWGKSRLVSEIENFPKLNSPKARRLRMKRTIAYWTNLSFGNFKHYSKSNNNQSDAYSISPSSLRYYRDDVFAVIMTIAVMVHGAPFAHDIESICFRGQYWRGTEYMQQCDDIKTNLNPFDIYLNAPDNVDPRRYSLETCLKTSSGLLKEAQIKSIETDFMEIMNSVRKDKSPRYKYIVEKLQEIVNKLL